MAKWMAGVRRSVPWTLAVAMLVLAACGEDGSSAGPERAGAVLAGLDPGTVVIERSDLRDFRAPEDPPAVTLALTAAGDLSVWDDGLGETVTTTLPDTEVITALVSLWDGAPSETDHIDDNEFVQHCIEGLTYVDPDGDRVEVSWDCGPPPGALDDALALVDRLRTAAAS